MCVLLRNSGNISPQTVARLQVIVITSAVTASQTVTGHQGFRIANFLIPKMAPAVITGQSNFGIVPKVSLSAKTISLAEGVANSF